jgi:hypothetical protein
LEKEMQQREHNGQENRRSPPAATSPGPSPRGWRRAALLRLR